MPHQNTQTSLSDINVNKDQPKLKKEEVQNNKNGPSSSGQYCVPFCLLECCVITIAWCTCRYQKYY